MTIVCAVLLSVAVVIGAGLFLFNLRNRVLAENERNLSNTALILAKQIEQIFTKVESVQNAIIKQTADLGISDAADLDLQLSQHEFHLKLRDQAAAVPFIGSFTIINAQGRVINSSRQWPSPVIDLSHRDYFKPLQSDPNLTSFVGGPVRGPTTQTMIMPLLRKITGPNNEFLGLFSAAIDLRSLQNNFSEVTIDADSAIALFRHDGMLLARFPRIDKNIGRHFPNATSLKLVSAASQGAGVSIGQISGHSRMVAAQRVGAYPIVISVTRTMAAVLADWRRTAAYVVSI
ncbi:MAG TPA: cache domain-containing protein, partial [Anaerolineae bacterium]